LVQPTQYVVIMEEYHFWQLQANFTNILLSRLILYAEEIVGDHQCGFRRGRSITNRIFCILQIHEKKWEYTEVVSNASAINRLQKPYDSVRRKILYNIPSKFGISRKLVRLLKMCLSNTDSRVRVGKNLSDIFPINNSLKN
jgi:hypothetical protein